MRLQFDAIDLFAGPGGWDLAARQLGLRVLGIELDDAACRTRDAAGHLTIWGDVRRIDPTRFAGVPGLIASPPCQTFSVAALNTVKGATGLKDRAKLIEAVLRYADNGHHHGLDESLFDPRTLLVLEPLRWALAIRPRWIVLEQVIQVFPIWEAVAEVLKDHGYDAVVGKIKAEQYGVPQTRRRAVLIAHRDQLVRWPAPTHQPYRQRVAREVPADAGGLLPWVSMAEALGWGMTCRPSMTGSGGTATGGSEMFGVGSRDGMRRQIAAGQWVQRSNYSAPPQFPGATAEERGRTIRELDEPSLTITGRPPSWQRLVDAGIDPEAAVVVGAGRTGGGLPRRIIDAPSPTLTAKNTTAILPSEQSYLGRGGLDRLPATPSFRDRHGELREGERAPVLVNGNQEKACRRSADEPAGTIYGGGRVNEIAWVGLEDEFASREANQSGVPADPLWPAERPSTAIVTRGLVAHPGTNPPKRNWTANRGKSRNDGLRVDPWEAGVLQSFPADYPWRGTKGKIHEQIGNAVPPRLALAILEVAAFD